jgi:hypothetical protein
MADPNLRRWCGMNDYHLGTFVGQAWRTGETIAILICNEVTPMINARAWSVDFVMDGLKEL